MGPECNRKYSRRGRQRDITQTEEEGQCDHRDRDWSDDATRQGMPSATRRWNQHGTDSLLSRDHNISIFHTGYYANQIRKST